MSASSGARPIVGITPEGLDPRGNIVLPRTYTDAIARAGGIPLILIPWGGGAGAAMERIDGLILAGGGDIDPALYGGDVAHPAVYEIDRRRDEFEIELVRMAVEREIPLLGICRGLQVINVALGGTLHAHLPDVVDGNIRHRGEPPAYVPHPVHLDSSARLSFLLDEIEVSPLSWHHQAIDKVGQRLQPEATAADGCIEGVELLGHPFLFGVQWHPEETASADAAQQRLFDGLVRAAGWRSDPQRNPSLGHYWSFDKCVFPTRSP